MLYRTMFTQSDTTQTTVDEEKKTREFEGACQWIIEGI
jgi:hypothetical protein